MEGNTLDSAHGSIEQRYETGKARKKRREWLQGNGEKQQLQGATRRQCAERRDEYSDIDPTRDGRRVTGKAEATMKATGREAGS
jgi:hypothetical protein